MKNSEQLARQLYGRAVFGDEWTAGEYIAESAITMSMELTVAGSGMPARRLVVIRNDCSLGRRPEHIYSAAAGLEGIVPVKRMCRTAVDGNGELLLLDTPLYNGSPDGTMPTGAVLELGIDVARSLASLQSAGLIHRNVKPRNICRSERGWLLDGLEMAEYAGDAASTSGVGTMLYLPAEAMNGRCDYTTDLYSLGVVMYSALNNGRLPFMGRYDAMTDEAVERALAARRSGAEIPPLQYTVPALDTIIRRALSPNPSLRFTCAADMLGALLGVTSTTGHDQLSTPARAAAVADMLMQNADFSSRFTLGGLLGAGMYGVVFRAVSLRDGMEYAVKAVCVPSGDPQTERALSAGLSPEEAADYYSRTIAKTASEALVYMQLTGCRHVLRMFDCSRLRTDEGREIFWMQTELLSPIPQSIPDERIVASIALDVCAALSEIHAMGMTHRDVKPANILWSNTDGYKLSDFGIARMLRDRVEATVIGSRSYMAPEILSGLLENRRKRAYDNTIDIFSLGMTMYTLLNDDREPFLPKVFTDADRTRAELRRLSGEQLPLPAHCGGRLGAIIARACAVEPRRRYRTADDMREALLNYLELLG